MKKILATIFSVIFFFTISSAIIGCQKAEEPQKAEPAKQEAPAQPAPEKEEHK